MSVIYPSQPIFMKQAYLGIKFYADQSNRPLIEMITAALTQTGWTTQVIVRDLEQWGAVQFKPQTLMARTFAVIETSDIAIIDLTEKGVGLGIEAGYAFAVSSQYFGGKSNLWRRRGTNRMESGRLLPNHVSQIW